MLCSARAMLSHQSQTQQQPQSHLGQQQQRLQPRPSLTPPSPYGQQPPQAHTAGLSPAATSAAPACFPYQPIPSPFLSSGVGGQSPHPLAHPHPLPPMHQPPPLFGHPFMPVPQQPPRLSPQPGLALSAPSNQPSGAANQTNPFSYGLSGSPFSPPTGSVNSASSAAGGPPQQSHITAQGSSSYFLPSAHQRQRGDEAVYGRTPSPLRSLHMGGSPLSLLPPHQPHSFGLSLASPSLLMQQHAHSHPGAASVPSQALFAHPGGGLGGHGLPLPSHLSIHPYLNPQQQQHGQSAPSFFSSLPPSLPAPYSSLAPVPPSHLPSTRWHCPGGCGKVLNKRSFRSLKKHKSICVLYMGWAKKNGAAGSSKQNSGSSASANGSSGSAASSAADSGGTSGDKSKSGHRQKREHSLVSDEQAAGSEAPHSRRSGDEQQAAGEEQSQEELEEEREARADAAVAGDGGEGKVGDSTSGEQSRVHTVGREGDIGENSPSKRQRHQTAPQLLPPLAAAMELPDSPSHLAAAQPSSGSAVSPEAMSESVQPVTDALGGLSSTVAAARPPPQQHSTGLQAASDRPAAGDSSASSALL